MALALTPVHGKIPRARIFAVLAVSFLLRDRNFEILMGVPRCRTCTGVQTLNIAWVVSIVTLTGATLMPLIGKASDRLGKKRVSSPRRGFVLGSVVCATAPRSPCCSPADHAGRSGRNRRALVQPRTRHHARAISFRRTGHGPRPVSECPRSRARSSRAADRRIRLPGIFCSWPFYLAALIPLYWSWFRMPRPHRPSCGLPRHRPARTRRRRPAPRHHEGQFVGLVGHQYPGLLLWASSCWSPSSRGSGSLRTR